MERLAQAADCIRFRRQQPAGPYVLDFYCHEARLCVEIDGQSHDFRAALDQQRDQWLASEGVRTLRIPANEVLHNLEGVIQHIVAEANAPPPSRCA